MRTIEQFKEFIDACNDPVIVCGMTFCPSDILEQLDPIAFRTFFNDYDAEEEEEDN